MGWGGWNLSPQKANHWDFIHNMNEAQCQKVISKKSIVFVLEVFVKRLGTPSTLRACYRLSRENI